MMTVLNTQEMPIPLAYGFTDMTSDEGMTDLFPGWLFWIGLIPITTIAALFYFSGYKMLAVICLGAYFSVTMLASPQWAIYIFLAWQAWDGIFLPSVTAVFTPAKALAFIVLLSYLLHWGRCSNRIFRENEGIIKYFIQLSLLFCLYGLMLIPVSVLPLATLRYALQILVLIGVVVGALKFIDTKERLRSAIFWLVVGGTLAAIGVLAGKGSTHYSRGTLAQNVNPNSIALALGVSLAAVPALWGLAKRKLDYILCIVCGALLMAGMMKTGSRASCGGIFLAYAIGGFMVKGRGYGKKILAAVLSVLFSFGVFFWVLSLNILPEKSQKRLEVMIGMSHDTKSTSSRKDVWWNALKTYLNQPLTGVGYGNTAAASAEYEGWHKDVHSSILAPLVEGGPIAFIIFIGMLGLLFWMVWQIGIPNPGIPAAIMYAYLVISCMTHTIHYTKWFWIMVLVCLLLVRLANDIKLKNQLAIINT